VSGLQDAAASCKPGESNGKLPLRTAQDAAYQSHTGRLTGPWFLPKLAQRLNNNNNNNMTMKKKIGEY